MDMAGDKGISRRRQRNGKTEKTKKTVHFQTVRAGGFDEAQIICYLWDLVKFMESEKTDDFPEMEIQKTHELEKQIRSKVRVEMRRYFLRQKRRSVKLISYTIMTLFFMTVLFTCVLGVNRVNGDSMYPYLNNGDWIVYSRIRTPVRRNDVMVFKKNGEILVKRVAGLPGDTVEISGSGGRVVVNGIQVREDFVTLALPAGDDSGNTENKEEFSTQMGIPMTVMDSQYLVLGDNRSISIDSRDSGMGTVAADEMHGKVFLVIRRNSIWN